jgi:DNA-binding NarL/FixJ family response regulator
VLVVDEDPRVRAALSSLLAGLDELEVVAIGPSEAGRLTEALVRDYEVGVVDVSERSPQSLGLLRRLGAAVPVVAMSMSGSMRLPALRAGAAAFVEKDGDGEAIHRAVATVRAARREEPGT